MKNIDKRESYLKEEIEERNSTISSRQSLSKEYKKWPTELWMKVIQRAIEDAALAKENRDKDKKISEEMKENEDSALSFLFNDDHRIPFDDFVIEIKCPRCNQKWKDTISKASEKNSVCSNCKYVINIKYIEYRITNEYITKSISLAELIEFWGVHDIEGFRDGCWNRIEELSRQKTKSKSKSKKTNVQVMQDIIYEINIVLEDKTLTQLKEIQDFIKNL